MNLLTNVIEQCIFIIHCSISGDNIMSRKRQQQHSEEVRNRILDIARRIVTDEGVEALSVRRITKEMDYSAGIVYHYFESKSISFPAYCSRDIRG